MGLACSLHACAEHFWRLDGSDLGHLQLYSREFITQAKLERFFYKCQALFIFRSRFLRVSIFCFVQDLANFVALPLGAYLFNSGSYVRVFATDFCLNTFAFLFLIIRLWDFEDKIRNSDLKIRGTVIDKRQSNTLDKIHNFHPRNDLPKACERCF